MKGLRPTAPLSSLGRPPRAAAPEGASASRCAHRPAKNTSEGNYEAVSVTPDDHRQALAGDGAATKNYPKEEVASCTNGGGTRQWEGQKFYEMRVPLPTSLVPGGVAGAGGAGSSYETAGSAAIVRPERGVASLDSAEASVFLSSRARSSAVR